MSEQEKPSRQAPQDAAPADAGGDALRPAEIDLLDKLLRGVITDEEGTVLAERMLTNAELRRAYLQQAGIHSTLMWSGGRAAVQDASINPMAIAEMLLEAEESARAQAAQDFEERHHCAADPMPSAVAPPRAPSRRLAWSLAAVAAVLLLIPLLRPVAQAPPERSVAALQRSSDAVWENVFSDRGDAVRATLLPGHRFTLGDHHRLVRGFAHVVTNTGAVLSIQAPSELEFLGDNHVRLIRGSLLAECEAKESQGFIVDTPRRRFIDLGTEFGVQVRPDGSVLAKVFEGKIAAVEVHRDAASDNLVEVEQSEALAIDAAGRSSIVESADDGNPFGHLAASRMGVVDASGDVLVIPRVPSALQDDAPQDQDRYVLMEEFRAGIPLAKDLVVDFQQPGRYVVEEFEPGPLREGPVLKSGTRVRSYLVYLHGAKTKLRHERGTIRFDGEILGVITSVRSWNDFCEAAPRSAVSYPRQERPAMHLLEGPDRVTISEDRRSLELKFMIAQDWVDAVRVLVATPDEGAARPPALSDE